MNLPELAPQPLRPPSCMIALVIHDQGVRRVTAATFCHLSRGVFGGRPRPPGDGLNGDGWSISRIIDALDGLFPARCGVFVFDRSCWP